VPGTADNRSMAAIVWLATPFLSAGAGTSDVEIFGQEYGHLKDLAEIDDVLHLRRAGAGLWSRRLTAPARLGRLAGGSVQSASWQVACLRNDLHQNV
jgi:hypothetical protein